MSEPIIIVLITVIGGSMLTGLSSIIQTAMTTKANKKHADQRKSEYEETKAVRDEHREESKTALSEVKDILKSHQEIIDKLLKMNNTIMRDRLRFLLKQYQEKDSVPLAERENIDEMYELYEENGNNGSTKDMYLDFKTKRIIQ